jgi:hypothetical protein
MGQTCGATCGGGATCDNLQDTCGGAATCGPGATCNMDTLCQSQYITCEGLGSTCGQTCNAPTCDPGATCWKDPLCNTQFAGCTETPCV